MQNLDPAKHTTLIKTTLGSHNGRGEPLQGNDKKKRRISQNKVVRSVRREYHNNWIIDNLPAASKVVEGFLYLPMQGFPVRCVDRMSRLSYIYNHVNIELQYHAVETNKEKYIIVGFNVEPFSINHTFEKNAEMYEEYS